MELMTINNEALANINNKELKKNIIGLQKAIVTGHKLGWTTASFINEIFMAENYEDDFDSDKELANFLNISTSYVAQVKGAISFIVKHSDLEEFLTVYRAYMLSTLTEEEYNDFTEWVNSNDIDIKTLSDKRLRAVLTEWKKSTEPVEVEVTEETEAEESVETVEEIAIIEFEGHFYNIPISVLSKYIVEE